MPFFTLYPENSPDINEQWFQSQLTRYGKTSYKNCFEEEVAALQAFYNHKTSVEQAANDITRPISNSPLQDLGGYSDDIVALCQLWYILKNALIEWPPSRTADIVALMTAITKVTDPIHRGEVLDENDQTPLSWAGLPWFPMVWSDAFWRTPGQIARQATNEASRQHELAVYIKQQDAEARLVAAGLLNWDRAGRYMIRTLERKPGPDDVRIAPSDGEADGQLKLEFQIPGVSKWIEHNGDRLYNSLDEINNWDKKTAWCEVKRFDPPSERWNLWQKRLLEIAEDSELETVIRDAARTALQHMQKIKAI